MKTTWRPDLLPGIRLCLSAVLVSIAASNADAQIYRFDIDRAESPVTEPGWTSFPIANAATSATLVHDGIDFRISSADGARLRGTVAAPVPNALLADFAFDDGDGQAVIFHFGTAGQLPADLWQVDVYSLDSGGGIAIEDQILGLRENGVETILANNIVESDLGPAFSFRFNSDGVSAYDFFLRENNTDNRTRLNAVVLSRVPEPATIGLLAAGGLALIGIRRWSK